MPESAARPVALDDLCVNAVRLRAMDAVQGAHAGQPISVALARSADGLVVARQSGTVGSDGTFSFTFAGLLQSRLDYSVDYWIDSNFGGGTLGHPWGNAAGATADRVPLEACVEARVAKLVVTSSGAAYGYHADNPPLPDENQPRRGNREFAYAWHKRLVEEMLAGYRREHPELAQVVFRVGTILGETTRNQITDLFDKPRLIALRGADSPFVFAWDQDVVACLVLALEPGREGVFNVAGDGALGVREIAARLGKRCVELPAWAIAGALALLKPLGLSQYGPEQVRFLRYRPVLDNRRLKEVFGYTPRRSSSETFDLYRQARSRDGAA